MEVSETSNSNPPVIDFTELPARKLLSIKELPNKTIPWSDVELPVDALLVTGKDDEFLSCVSYLNPGFYKSFHKDIGFLYFGKIGEQGNSMKIALMKMPPGSRFLIMNAVDVLRPKAVFGVGCCSGLNEVKVKLGDVVISSKCWQYAFVKTGSGIRSRDIDLQLNQRPPWGLLARLILSANYGWTPPLNYGDEMEVRVIRYGVILSGPEIVDSKERRAELIERFPDAIVMDMESGGEI